MMTRKARNMPIQIPESLRIEMDKIVRTGLYSNQMEFVSDAVRRLLIQNKMEEDSRYSEDEKVTGKDHDSNKDKRMNITNFHPP